MRLIIVRHGETELNVRRVLQGQGPNVSLNETGREQARRLAERLRCEKLVRAFSSDLIRAHETASEILRYHPGVELQLTPALRERGFGVMDGISLNDFLKASADSGEPFYRYKPDGGESFEDVEERVREFLFTGVFNGQEEPVLLVGHALVNKLVLKVLLGWSYIELKSFVQGNTCVNIIDYSAGKAVPVVLNCLEHLEQAEV